MSKGKLLKVAKDAKEASYSLNCLSNTQRNAILKTMASDLLKNRQIILNANQKDLKNAKANNLSKAMIGRLELNDKKIKGMSQGLIQIAKLKNPLDHEIERTIRPNGLIIKKLSVPLGVILIIYESRPNVTADCAGLCIKSGNSVILRGGREAFYSNQAIHKVLTESLKTHKIPVGAVSFIESTKHEDVDTLLGLTEWIDLVIPRGGESLIHKIAAKSKIPVIKHYQGICHTFIDKDANVKTALDIADNAKTQNPGVCNAMETLLIHSSIAKKILPRFAKIASEKGVEIRGCDKTKKILPSVRRASDKDWATEYLDLILSIKVVKDVEEAISHIRKYGSHHSDAIVGKSKINRKKFIQNVDSACVFENASTRFSDGGEFGMGAEMGISTDKLHARGPVGIRELTSYKYVISGKGQIRN